MTKRGTDTEATLQTTTELIGDRQLTSVPTLMAGPLHGLGVRLGLIRPDSANTLLLGLAIAGLLWAVLMLLAAATGTLNQLLSLSVIAGHVRILVALPLILACEGVVEAALGPFVRGLMVSEIVRGAAVTALQRECDRFNRLTSSRLPEVLLFIVATVPDWVSMDVPVFGATAMRPVHTGAEMPAAGLWYWLVCLPVFRFLLLRAVFRLGVWYLLLWRLSRIELNLVPTHPDRVGGLRFVAEVQLGFILLTAAVATVVSAAIAEQIATQGGHLRSHYGTIVVTLLACATAFIAPLLMFAGRLWRVRLRGRAAYADLAAGYVGAFDAKWLCGGAGERDLLGSADLQSLADLGNSVQVIDEMKIAPVTQEMVVQYAMAGIIPMLPLLLFEFPMDEIAAHVLEKLLGA
ncbi:hypothetical protein ACLF3G_23355 [Falsiroseomonas sp. HC035]|uniref:hypothetical protein n=1 Tax=Falsiroseomonas sp. HC035 TaxID=3390999 RepID=UPI003D3219D0